MLKIRLSRTGKKHAPSFRIVVIPKERPRDGETLEVLGYFNPSVNPPTFLIDKTRLKYWVERGAQMTETVEKLIKGKYKFKPYQPRKVSSQEAIDSSSKDSDQQTQADRQESEVSSKKKTEEGKTERVGKPKDQDSKPKGKAAKTEVGAKKLLKRPQSER